MPPRNRFVRRRPLSERLQDYLDPGDWMLWLNEQLDSELAEQLQEYGTAIGLAANFLFLITRANSGGNADDGDVFGDYEGRLGSGWFAWFCHLLSYTLAILSTANAAHVVLRRRPYRLFEQPLDFTPQTPSARRVRVDSSPAANASPFRLITNVFSREPATARAHPQPGRDVWEISVWDPPALGLKLLCLFSPLHVLLYMLFLPTAPLDPTPSITYLKTLLLAALLSAQALFLRSNFAQQHADREIISKHVLHEYDTKFVHPTLHQPVRDVAVQTPPQKDDGTRKKRRSSGKEVEAYAPHSITTRGFRIEPNPAYAQAYDPDRSLSASDGSRRATADAGTGTGTSFLTTPIPRPKTTPHIPPSSAATGADFSSPLRPVAAKRLHRSPVRHSTGTTATGGEGGSLGVYSHAASPLRKAASQNFLNRGREREREGSPLKRVSRAAGGEEGFRVADERNGVGVERERRRY